MVKAESGPALVEVERLLAKEPDMRIFVVGHADSRQLIRRHEVSRTVRIIMRAAALIGVRALLFPVVSRHGVTPVDHDPLKDYAMFSLTRPSNAACRNDGENGRLQ